MQVGLGQLSALACEYVSIILAPPYGRSLRRSRSNIQGAQRLRDGERAPTLYSRTSDTTDCGTVDLLGTSIR